MVEEKLSIPKRIINVVKQVTVEPVVFTLLIGSLLASTASQTLGLEKACRVNLNLSDAVCDAVRNQDSDDNADNERIVQAYIATLLTYKSIITSILPCILLVFAGGWMDVTGRRKIIMLMAVTGEILVQTNNIVNVLLFYQLRVEFLILFEGFFGSVFGGWSLIFLSAFSYITDITTEENRTYRLGLVNFSLFLAVPVGTALSGVLLKNFGYLTVFIISLILSLLNTSYVIFILSDPERTKEHKQHDNRGFVYVMKNFFNPAHLMNSLRVFFKKTNDNRALRLCILLGAACFFFGPMSGEAAVLYMSTRYRFGWDELQYSNFMAYSMVVTIVGSIFCIVVISKILGWHDSVIGIMSSSSKIAASFVYALAQTGPIFYIAPLVDIFNGNAFMALRSIFSKSVEPHEIGKLNSIVGIFEVIMPLAYVPLYTQVYAASMEVMPGFVFLLGAFLSIPVLLVFIWLLYKHLNSVKLQKLRESSPEEES